MISTKSLSTINVNRILRTLWESQTISRIDIARTLDLSKSTITLIMTQLMERSIVVEKEIGQATGSGGRRPVGLGINGSYGAILGIEFQTDLARVVAISLDGAVVLREEELLGIEPQQISTLLETTISRFRDRLRQSGWTVIAASLGVSGIIDPATRCIRTSNPLSIREPVFLDPDLDQRLGMPIFIDNDAKCCCWAQLADRTAPQQRHFMYVLGEHRNLNVSSRESRGLAIGMAFVIDGKVHYGHNFTSGEFSSAFKRDENPTQFSVAHRSELDQPLDDPQIRQRLFQELADNIALVANLLNLESVGFAGDIVQYRDELAPVLRDSIRRNWSYPDQAQVEVSFTPFEEWAVAHGAAALVLEQLFVRASEGDEQARSLPAGIELFDVIEAFSAQTVV